MLTGKQRAYLRKLAHTMDAVLQIGKQGITPEAAAAADEALEARELIKISVLDNCEHSPKEVAEILSGRTRSECVQVIGKKFVLYRRSKGKRVVEL